jgi:hypothetical protein
MTRREAAAVLVGARALAGPRKRLAQVIGDIPGAALLVDVRSRRLIAVHAPDLAGALLVPPGSAIKPFTVEALLQGGKVRADDKFACPGTLAIGGRAFNCSHPPVVAPMDVPTALAYSCNCFVAHYAPDGSAMGKARDASNGPRGARRNNCRPSARAACW